MSPREVVHNEAGQVAVGLGVTGEAIHPSEVLSRHGVGGNAELLIQAVREHNPAALRAALAKKVDIRRTDLLKAGELDYPESSKDDYAGELVNVGAIAGEGATVQDVAVRGVGSVTYSATDSQGTLYKGTFELADPEGTHISQAELLGQKGSVAEPIVGAKRQAQQAAQTDLNERRATLDAREKALAQREREVAEAEAAQQEGGDAGGSPEDEPAGDQAQEGEGAPDRPAALPANFDDLNADDAAAVVAKLEGEERTAALAYEDATKKRTTVLKLGESSGS